MPLVHDPDGLVRSAVIETLVSLRLGDQDVLAAFLSAFDDTCDVFSTDARRAASLALGRLSSLASTALPRLRHVAAEDENPWVRDAAETAIRETTEDR